ncbi:MAG: flagellar hook-basal body complex protein FliE [Clostridia bacterium]|nr:flagellar hook-basal body complex protein FliE [Clostridia bacterium]
MADFIVPISSKINVKKIDWLDERGPAVQEQGPEDSTFRTILDGIVNNVETTQAQTKLDSYNLSIGNMDDMHTMLINATKAELALQTMVELRNKLLDAYTEVMRTNL